MSKQHTHSRRFDPHACRVKPVLIGDAAVYLGDSASILPHLSGLDATVTDGPYGLGFMGKAWDYAVPKAGFWSLCLEAMKPGAWLLNFYSSRTYHRGACEIEDGGFEIRDQIMWVYGSGFPKSHDVSKAIDKMLGARRSKVGIHSRPGYNRLQVEHGLQRALVTSWDRTSDESITADAGAWEGWGTALKPAHEPIVVARKPITQSVARNVLQHGTGALNIDACRVEGGRFPANLIHDGSDDVVAQFPHVRTSKGTRHQRSSNAIYRGRGCEKTGELSANGGDAGSAARFFYVPKSSRKERDEGLSDFAKSMRPWFQTGNGTSGQASMEGKGQRVEGANKHPTVKPVALMRYLCRLVTKPGGVILDPFLGSGTTGVAAVTEGFRFVGIERDPESFAISCARIAHAQGLPIPKEVWQIISDVEGQRKVA